MVDRVYVWAWHPRPMNGFRMGFLWLPADLPDLADAFADGMLQKVFPGVRFVAPKRRDPNYAYTEYPGEIEPPPEFMARNNPRVPSSAPTPDKAPESAAPPPAVAPPAPQPVARRSVLRRPPRPPL